MDCLVRLSFVCTFLKSEVLPKKVLAEVSDLKVSSKCASFA